MQSNSIDLFGHPISETKHCTACKQTLPIDAFYKMATKNGRKYYHQSWCKECLRKKNVEYHRTPAGAISDMRRKLRKNHGIELESYQQMLQKQKGVCAICKQEEKSCKTRGQGTRPLSVDHDHVTGQIRGLLCSRCNAGLGNFRDDPERLREAIAYLQSFGK
jgi:hypothetical protein